MDVDGKVAAIHTVAAVAVGYISFKLTNEAMAIVIAIIVLYLMGQVSERLFGKEEVGGMKGWLWSGIVPFFFIWLMTWVIFMNHPL
ncbi:MAG: DUF5379 family protein [Methanobacterium sp.]|uniref:EMC6-like membrane protein n=1 Tax=Methanobacterium sp. TaxID=2164 RepID=UPI003D65093C|nr:DUF5379 family protein [Methanobacterium sp.]